MQISSYYLQELVSLHDTSHQKCLLITEESHFNLVFLTLLYMVTKSNAYPVESYSNHHPIG